jgi:hypothetical protein
MYRVNAAPRCDRCGVYGAPHQLELTGSGHRCRRCQVALQIAEHERLGRAPLSARGLPFIVLPALSLVLVLTWLLFAAAP